MASIKPFARWEAAYVRAHFGTTATATVVVLDAWLAGLPCGASSHLHMPFGNADKYASEGLMLTLGSMYCALMNGKMPFPTFGNRF